uniref:Coiled-coil domain-containing protein n=1 Tax=Salarias fasciatus TaxID=181472 RepID=A0A672GKS5_SALFA
MPTRPASASEGFSSTPIKTDVGKDSAAAKDFQGDVLSDDEDTFSLLSPIYHDSFDTDEEDPESIPARGASPGLRCCSSPTLGAWEMWLVNKAKEDRLKLEQKAEERLFKEKQEQQERERKEKSIVVEEKIHEWLRMKREKEIQRQQEKQREIEQKAQQKYKDWLQKKNQEKNEKEKKEKEDAALKEEQEKERRRKAEEKFKEWLAKANEKDRAIIRELLRSLPQTDLFCHQ